MANPTIFISYNRKDGAMAKRIGAAFRDAGFAISAVRSSTTDPGALKQELVSKINAADCVVALISPNSLASRRFRAETGYATKREKLIVPALVGGKEVPAQFEDTHYGLVDASSNEVQDFVAYVRERLEPEEEEEEEIGFDDLLDSLEDEEPDPGERLMPTADELRQYQEDAEAKAKERTTPPEPRQTAGSLWTAPGGGPSNFVLTLAVAALIMVGAVVVVLNLPEQEESGQTQNTDQQGEENPIATEEGPIVVEPGQADVPDGWTTYRSAGFSLAVPSEWIDASDQAAIQEAIDILIDSGGDPEAIEALRLTAESGALELMLIDPITGTNVNLARAASPSRMTLDDIEREVVSVYATMGLNISEIEVVSLPVGEMLKLTVANSMVPDMVMTQTQYILVDDRTLYTVTLTEGMFESTPIDGTFAQIMQTVRLN